MQCFIAGGFPSTVIRYAVVVAAVTLAVVVCVFVCLFVCLFVGWLVGWLVVCFVLFCLIALFHETKCKSLEKFRQVYLCDPCVISYCIQFVLAFFSVVGKLAEPMIWYYRTDLRTHFPRGKHTTRNS